MKKYIITLLTVLTLALAGCADGTSNHNTENEVEKTPEAQEQKAVATIKLTKDGEEVISEEAYDFAEGESLMEVMERNFEITTGYGGGFIVGIDGLESDEEAKYAWMIAVNNEDLMVGADEYVLEQDDVVHFNYEKWE